MAAFNETFAISWKRLLYIWAATTLCNINQKEDFFGNFTFSKTAVILPPIPSISGCKILSWNILPKVCALDGIFCKISNVRHAQNLVVANQSALKIILKFLIANKMQNFHHFEPLQKSSLIIVGKIQNKNPATQIVWNWHSRQLSHSIF